ncbi:MAG: peroxidase [Planctomycetes bacterium]|nr:peroxidase [Planctomycetota bacterium]
MTLDASLVRQLVDDYTRAPIDAQDCAMLDFAVKLTRDAVQVTKADHERLKLAGFDERGILQITLIASFFNYINRVADALGVGRNEDGSDKPLLG